jgi:hypothetical protein
MGGRIQPPFGSFGSFLPLICKVIYFSFSWTLLFFGAILNQMNQILSPPFSGMFPYNSYNSFLNQQKKLK